MRTASPFSRERDNIDSVNNTHQDSFFLSCLPENHIELNWYQFIGRIISSPSLNFLYSNSKQQVTSFLTSYMRYTFTFKISINAFNFSFFFPFKSFGGPELNLISSFGSDSFLFLLLLLHEKKLENPGRFRLSFVIQRKWWGEKIQMKSVLWK